MAKLQKGQLSMKRVGVDKTNSRIIAISAISAFLVIFFLVGSWSLFGQLRYQNRIIGAKKDAVKQLKTNLTARDSLVASYKDFSGSETNFIGGSSSGAGAQDGTNPKLVLDSLPSSYDFPALATSLEKIATDQKVSIDSMNGTDDSVAQAENATTGTPRPVEMPFQMRTTGGYGAIQSTVDAFDRSIRPVQFRKLQITGDSEKTSLSIDGVTFYQPGKTFNLGSKVIK